MEKRWTFTELKAWNEEVDIEKSKPSDEKPPAHWPAGIEVDTRRHAWVPSDWGQGVKVSAFGNKGRVFISPGGKLFHNKRDVENFLGIGLEGAERPEDTKERGKDVPPRKDWPDWLPLDWTMCGKTSGQTVRAYYIGPTGHGFFNRSGVEQFLSRNAPGKAKEAVKSKKKDETAASKAADPVPTDLKDGPTTSGTATPDSKAPAVESVESPAKRLKLDASLAEEVERLNDGDPFDGCSLKRLSAGPAWLVLPDDVLSLDLKAIGGQVEAAGWKRADTDETKWTFAGSPDLVLHASGKLLVFSTAAEEAKRVAKQFVDSWLALE